MVKSWLSLPDLDFRKEVVKLIQEGRAQEAIDMLVKYYELPRPIRVVKPEDLLKAESPCLYGFQGIAFEFPERDKLAQKYPDEWERHVKLWISFGIKPPPITRIGWVISPKMQLEPELEETCPYYIVVSEKYFTEPPVFLHEFHHIHLEILGEEKGLIMKELFEMATAFSDIRTWDPFTRSFLIGTGYFLKRKR